MRRADFEHLIAAVALCLEIHDLMLSKCAAGRERDWEYVTESLKCGLVRYEHLDVRVDELPISVADRNRMRKMLAGIHGRVSS